MAPARRDGESRAGGGTGAADRRVRRSQCPNRARRPEAEQRCARPRPHGRAGDARAARSRRRRAGRRATSPRRTWSCSMTRSCSPQRAPAIAQGRSAGFAWRAALRASARAARRCPTRACASAPTTCSTSSARCCCVLQGKAAGAPRQFAGRRHPASRDELLPSQLSALERRAPRRHLHGRAAVRPRTWRSWPRPWGSRRWSRSARGCCRIADGTAAGARRRRGAARGRPRTRRASTQVAQR